MEITLLQRERWICQNGACGSEIAVIKPGEVVATGLPRCRCGSIMKKFYSPPTFRHITGEEAEMLFRDPAPVVSPDRHSKK
jgi:hypothetical protein